MRLVGFIAAATVLIPSAAVTKGRIQSPKLEKYTVGNVVIHLANSPASGYVTADLDVRAQAGASLEGIGADIFLMGPDRTLFGQGGSIKPTIAGDRAHFQVGPALFNQKQCPPRFYAQQIVVISRNAVIIDTVPVVGRIVPSSKPGGCH